MYQCPLVNSEYLPSPHHNWKASSCPSLIARRNRAELSHGRNDHLRCSNGDVYESPFVNAKGLADGSPQVKQNRDAKGHKLVMNQRGIEVIGRVVILIMVPERKSEHWLWQFSSVVVIFKRAFVTFYAVFNICTDVFLLHSLFLFYFFLICCVMIWPLLMWSTTLWWSRWAVPWRTTSGHGKTYYISVYNLFWLCCGDIWLCLTIKNPVCR